MFGTSLSIFQFTDRVLATTLSLENVVVGDNISLNGQEFVKLNDSGLLMMASTLTCPHGKMIAGKHMRCFTCPAGSTYDATNVTCNCTGAGYVWDWRANACVIARLPEEGDQTNCTNPIDYMDSWNDCASLNEFDTVCLTDRRDYRTYRVRKFADGQCWMIDSLHFGGKSGQIDGCAVNNGEGNFTYAWCGGSSVPGCTAGGSTTLAQAQEQFVSGWYGHCRVNNVDHNYQYDWGAAMQSTLAYNGSTYGSNGEYTTPWQGICPNGWRLPVNGVNNDFQILVDNYGTIPGSFWTEENKWSGKYSGLAYSGDGHLIYQGVRAFYWTMTYYGEEYAYNARISSDEDIVQPRRYMNKMDGRSVRCIKN